MTSFSQDHLVRTRSLRGLELLALSVLFLCLAHIGLAQDVNAERAFYRGNELFEKKDFAGARTAYREAYDLGIESAELDYNLGLACLQSGSIGESIFHFRRALELSPRDDDAKKNLEIARSRAVDRIQRKEPPAFVRGLLWPHTMTTIQEASILFLTALVIGMALLHLRVILVRSWPTKVAIPFLIVALLMGASLVCRALDVGRLEEGVILAEEVDVFTGPSDTYNVFFKLHSGTEVEVLETTGNWVKIAVDAERRGYVPASKIAH